MSQSLCLSQEWQVRAHTAGMVLDADGGGAKADAMHSEGRRAGTRWGKEGDDAHRAAEIQCHMASRGQRCFSLR